jgi:hypothetical protein
MSGSDIAVAYREWPSPRSPRESALLELDVAFGQASTRSVPPIRFVLEELDAALSQHLTEPKGPYVEHGAVDVKQGRQPVRRAPSTLFRRALVRGVRVACDREGQELAIVRVPAQVVEYRTHTELRAVHLVTRATRSQSQVDAFSKGHRVVRKHQHIQAALHLDGVGGADNRSAMAAAHVDGPVIEMR